jgi:hypothetical protein
MQKTNAMSLEELSATPCWRKLSPGLKRVLTICFAETDFDMIAAVTKFESRASHDLQIDMARRVFVNEKVQAVIALYIFGFDLAAQQDVPLAPNTRFEVSQL